MIPASIGPPHSIASKTITHTFPNTRSSNQPPSPTELQQRLVLHHDTRAVTTAIGSTLLHSHSSISPCNRRSTPTRLLLADHARKTLDIGHNAIHCHRR